MEVTNADAFRYSIVVPVFNEAENIGAFCSKALQELPSNFELLICYDFDADNTLPALAAIGADRKPPNTRLVKNDLGRGVRYAIDAGMRAALAPVVVVMMADLSDDFPKVNAMVLGCEEGAEIVCASRYMKGGKQIGGPWVKGMLSRMAGVTLHYLTGLPTHDPTNSFKAYRRDFLRKTPIESTAGFCLAMELDCQSLRPRRTSRRSSRDVVRPCCRQEQLQTDGVAPEISALVCLWHPPQLVQWMLQILDARRVRLGGRVVESAAQPNRVRQGGPYGTPRHSWPQITSAIQQLVSRDAQRSAGVTGEFTAESRQALRCASRLTRKLFRLHSSAILEIQSI